MYKFEIQKLKERLSELEILVYKLKAHVQFSESKESMVESNHPDIVIADDTVGKIKSNEGVWREV